jgi:hypothetical protein
MSIGQAKASKKTLLKPLGTRVRKKRGRPVHWLKNPPPHLKGEKLDPKIIFAIKESENQWREMCRNGITSDYFELCDVTDPDLMGKDALDWNEAIKIPKYKAALKKIDDAKKRNRAQIKSISEKGAFNSKLNAEARREQLKEYLYAEGYTYPKYDSYSIRGWADDIYIKEGIKKIERRWDGGRINKPSPTHLRGILKKIRDSNKTK